MKKKYKIILILVVIVSLIAIVLFFFNDEKPRVLTKYDSKTKETTTLEYILKDSDTIFHGKFLCLNEKGHKTYEGNFVNGQITGKSIYYFENGVIESIFYRKNTKSIEETTYNYPNGKIKKYIMYDDLGVPDFLIRYDKMGNIESYEGLPLVEIYQYKIANKEKFKTKINQHLKVGDTLKQQYLVANIANTKRSFKIENLDIDNIKIKRTFKKTSHLGYEVNEILTKKGINTIRAVVRYQFRDKEKTIITDTLSFQVTVN